MKKIELEEIKGIANSFHYGAEKTSNIKSKMSNEEMIKIGKKIADSFLYEEKKILAEESFDDFDTAYESLRIGVEQELKNFIINLLVNNVENFMWTFVEPTTQTFKEVWDYVLTRFTVADDALRDQFLNRMKILFRNIFIEKLAVGDEETAIELADAYFTVFKVAINQLLDKMKDNMEGQSTEPAQDWKDGTERQIEYR